MRARPEVKRILISQKLRKWSMIAQHPFVDPTCPPSRARRNFFRLLSRGGGGGEAAIRRRLGGRHNHGCAQ